MAEALSEAVKSTGVKILWKSGGEFFIDISTDNVEVAKEVCKTAIKLSALYVGYQLLRPVIDAAVKKALGGERDDQEVKDIKPGSLHVVLHCFTDERFLEVLTDYLSGKMKERLEEEFLQVEHKVKGLIVMIKNMTEVNEIKKAIYKRYHRCVMKKLTRVAVALCCKFQQDIIIYIYFLKDNIEIAFFN